MKTPVLDPRTKQDIMDLTRRRAAEYTPEWRFGDDASDPGVALASLFGDMFYETVDRFNSLPQKTYSEFLNLLGVQVPPLTPAVGFLRFDVHTGIDSPVAVPAGTAVYAKDEEGENIVYETERRVEATPAQLGSIYFSDSREGVIQRLATEGELPFFRRTDAENLQRHMFEVAQNDVLSRAGACTVELRIKLRARFMEDAAVKRLADPDFASWSWFDGEKQVPFDSVTPEGSTLRLEKRATAPMAEDERGHIALRCEMKSAEGSISLDGASLRSVPTAEIRADSLSFGDVPIEQGEGGYCFGRTPSPYGLFYVRSDCAFRKRGALAKVRLDITSIVYSEVDGQPQYTYGKRLIDKSDAVTIKADDVFVQQVVWEYFNGNGWAPLNVRGNKNPFSGKADGELAITFTVPEDLSAVIVNADEGYYIRARVVNIENYLSPNPKWILPFIKEAGCAWQYPEERRADWISATNNGRTEELEGDGIRGELSFTVFSNLEDRPRSMYLRFDRSPHGMPLSMFFEIAGRASPEGKIIYEMWTGSRFERLRLVDGTRNMSYTGPVFLYVTQPLPEAEFFGESGYWLRMSLSSFAEKDENCPTVSGVRLNIVSAVQRQSAPEQLFSCGVYEADKRVRLTHFPVMSCEVWVDESERLAVGDIERMEIADPDGVRVERDGYKIISCRVRWRQINTLARAGENERVYELDSFTGVITFGNGKRGMVPPSGYRNIRVSYSYGGGTRGNLPAGAVTEFLGSVPRIGSLVNITPMSGGTDRREPEKLEALGNRRIRNRGKAVGVSDFEELIAERFSRAMHVKCFPGLDESGRKAPGHVCVVVMGGDLDGERMARDLCLEIYDFLAQRADCCTVAAGRLHVRPSTDMTVNVSMDVQMRDLDLAAETQQRLSDTVRELINGVWRSRDIGRQINHGELFRAIKSVPNVEVIKRVSVEGVYYEDGRLRVRPIGDDSEFPFATVTSGSHTVRIF